MDRAGLRRELEDSERIVLVSAFPYDMTAKHELAGAEIIAYSVFGEEGWEAILRDLRHGLALACQVGKLVLVFDSISALEDEQAEAAEAAFAALSEDERRITFEDVARAHEEEAERSNRMAAFFERLGEFTAAQQQTPDEDITIGEAIERHEQGSEKVRKIVEGEDECEG
jgi:hypothetical protein